MKPPNEKGAQAGKQARQNETADAKVPAYSARVNTEDRANRAARRFIGAMLAWLSEIRKLNTPRA